MGLFLRQDEQRSEVQQRVASELQERLRATAEVNGEHEPAFLENQHQTRHAGIVIGFLIILICIVLIIFAIQIS